MLGHHSETGNRFPDTLIARSQCLAGSIERGTPSIADMHDLLQEIPNQASPRARLIAKQVLMRVLGRFASTLDARRDAASIQAFITWSRADVLSEHWREDLVDLVDVWTAAHASMRVGDLRVRRALEALDGRYADPDLALDDIAAAAGLSPWQATRLLKRESGRGFIAHLHGRRIAASRIHLIETTLSIKEIADRVGYKSASEFGRHFRRACGTTPRHYRLARASA